MRSILEEISKIFQVKKIIALCATIVFCILSLRKENGIKNDQFLIIFSSIISYYFGQSSARQTMKETISTTNSNEGNG